MYILGISCYYHDSAACLLKDESIIAAAEEERFTREKHDSSFPTNAVQYCLEEAKISADDLDYVGFYEKPIDKFDRILETFLTVAPYGIRSFMNGIPLWLRNRLWMKDTIQNELGLKDTLLFGSHHRSHAASTFYASPFEEAAILTVDGVGEWNTTTWGIGSHNQIDIRGTIDFPHSLGLLYSAFTEYLGFKVNNGEYKVMGLSSYGDPKYVDVIYDELLDLKGDGTFRLNMDYFSYLSRPKMTNSKFADLFGYPRREPDSDLNDHHFDIAMSAQRVTEEILLQLVDSLYKRTEKESLCMAGGVALNSVANGRILRESPFTDIFIQPAAGDDGTAYGIAADIYYQALDNERTVPSNRTERMQGSYLGPDYDSETIELAAKNADIATNYFDDTSSLLERTATLLKYQNVIGLYQGRMEWGPRALGNRSILADPRDADMQNIVNRKIKFREGFRPFAPSVLKEEANNYFNVRRESPYMLFVFDVVDEKREEISAVTHVDGTSRIQTVDQETNKVYYDLIEEFRKKTGTPLLLNTSLNRRGEPIVNTPTEAINCFLETNMDYMCFPDTNLLITNIN